MLDDFRDDEENLEKGGEFLDEFRQRLNSQPIENLEERKNDINKSQHIFLGTILGVGLAGLVGWFILSPDYKKAEDAEIPVVRRPQTAIKVQPADPGGMEILNQDKTVYDIVEKKDSEDIKVENLLPPPEEPSLVAVQIEEEKAEKEVAQVDPIKEAEKIFEAEDKVAKQKQEIENIKEEPKIETSQEPKEAIKIVSVEEKPKTEIKQPVPEEKKNETKESSAPLGSWQIQLISSPNKAAMEKAWSDLTKKYVALQKLPHEVESADLGSKGTFYRLKAGAFKDREEADKLCNTIKARGGSCLVKKK